MRVAYNQGRIDSSFLALIAQAVGRWASQNEVVGYLDQLSDKGREVGHALFALQSTGVPVATEAGHTALELLAWENALPHVRRSPLPDTWG